DRRLAGVAAGTASIDAVVILVAAAVLGELEVSRAAVEAGHVGGSGVGPALLRVLHRPGAHRAVLHARPEALDPQVRIALAAVVEGVLRALANIQAAQEAGDLGVVDAGVPGNGIVRVDHLAVGDRRIHRGVARLDEVGEAGGVDALRALLAAGFDAVVVLVDAGVLRDLEIFLAVALALLVVSCGGLDALADLAGQGIGAERRDERRTQGHAKQRTAHDDLPLVDDDPLTGRSLNTGSLAG